MMTININTFKASKVKEVMKMIIKKRKRKTKLKNQKVFKDRCFNIKLTNQASLHMLSMVKLCQLIKYFLIKVRLDNLLTNLIMIVLSDLKIKSDLLRIMLTSIRNLNGYNISLKIETRH